MASDRVIAPVNQRVRQIRNALELSQAKFAMVISISKGYIADVEIGVRKVNDRIIKLICTSFNVNDCWLRNGEGEMFSENPAKGYTKLMSFYRELDSEYQEFIMNQIIQLLDIQTRHKKTCDKVL
jgi:transcriptional regulator with XRE-family HTH domain